MEAPPLSSEELCETVDWVASFPLSRVLRNRARDFSDGVLMSEILKWHYPSLIQSHNYQAANSSASKFVNWKTLNERVLRKLGFVLHRKDIEDVISSVPGAIERVLAVVKARIEEQTAVPDQVISTVRTVLDSKESKSKEREDTIRELREVIEILESKMNKMEQLLKLKDNKIETLIKKIEGKY